MITSPCINICKMDASSGLCQGCFRTIDEITAWTRIDDPARIHILAEVARRRLELDPGKGSFHTDGNKHE